MTVATKTCVPVIASTALLLALVGVPVPARAEPVNNQIMFVNARTNKCVTIAGGVSTDNNVESVQFRCDEDPSRRWMMRETAGGIYQLRNVQTGKCLTIAGGISTANNVVAVQFDCDDHPSRTWRISDVTGSGIHQLRNVQTNKCLTVEGGISPNDNLRLVQFNCDVDQSRRWVLRVKL